MKFFGGFLSLGLILFVLCSCSRNKQPTPEIDSGASAVKSVTNNALPKEHETDYQKGPTSAAADNATEHHLNDIVSEVVGRKLEEGHSITNGSGSIAETQFPDGSTLYFESNMPVKLVDKSGRATSYEFDAEGRHLRTVLPDGTADTFQYNENGQKISASLK
jgi:YD repeat-containing protein